MKSIVIRRIIASLFILLSVELLAQSFNKSIIQWILNLFNLNVGLFTQIYYSITIAMLFVIPLLYQAWILWDGKPQ